MSNIQKAIDQMPLQDRADLAAEQLIKGGDYAFL